jgi:hypothetical protein
MKSQTILDSINNEDVVMLSVNDTLVSENSCDSGSDITNKQNRINKKVLNDIEVENNTKEKDELDFFISFDKKKEDDTSSKSFSNNTGYYYHDNKYSQTTEVNSTYSKSINTLLTKNNINGNLSEVDYYSSDSSSKKLKKYKNEHLKENAWFIKMLGILTATIYLIVFYTVWIKK